MGALSARFVILACLCAALPLALPPVEAAHLYGRHDSSSNSHHKAQSAPSVHSHDGKHHGHKARGPVLPPLLRRDRAHDHKKVVYHQDQDSRNHAHSKGFRSAFARSRYRREPGTHTRRSSIYFSGEHGNTYLVSRTPPRSRGNARTGTDRRSSHASHRRQADEGSLVLGKIDIMTSSQSAGNIQRLASLAVDSTPFDWTWGDSSTKAFQLNASTTNQTQFIMMPTEDASDVEGSLSKHVALATEVFDANSAEMVMYCATYNPDPGSTSPLIMTPCTGGAQLAAPADDAIDPCSDVADDASSQLSQIFSYDPASGNIEPISATASSSAVDDSSDDSNLCAGARVRRDTGNSTTSSSTRPSGTSTSTAPTIVPSQQAQNVTLVYVAGALEVPAGPPSASNSASTNTGQVPVFTTTITTTVVTTVAATSSPNRTPAQAAVSVSASSTPSIASLPTATIVRPPVPTTTAPRSSSSLSVSRSLPATTTSKPPVNAASLEVEVVGVTPSTTAGSLSTSSTATTPTASSLSSANPSLNAQAVASSIANSMVHRPRVFAEASVSAISP